MEDLCVLTDRSDCFRSLDYRRHSRVHARRYMLLKDTSATLECFPRYTSARAQRTCNISLISHRTTVRMPKWLWKIPCEHLLRHCRLNITALHGFVALRTLNARRKGFRLHLRLNPLLQTSRAGVDQMVTFHRRIDVGKRP